MTATTATPDLETIKTRQRGTWASGDYARIGTTLQIVGEDLAEAITPTPGSRVLDVAAGNGNATLAMARRWCDVTSTDYVPELLEQGARRADAEGLSVTFTPADAEKLPFENGSFDVVTSTFGVMFTPDQARAAAELVRVCRSGGRIGMANWTPDGFVGGLFRTIGRHIPPPPGVNPPALWGTRDWLLEHFLAHATEVDIELRTFNFVYPSAQVFVDFFRAWYGPVERAFATLDESGARDLELDLLQLVDEFNIARDGTMRVPAEYAQVVVDRA